jgi:hypothetical protein
VPLATFLEVERELRELRRQGSQPARQPAQPQQQAPDLGDMLYTDPERFVQTLTQNFQGQLARIQLDNDLQRAADKIRTFGNRPGTLSWSVLTVGAIPRCTNQ